MEFKVGDRVVLKPESELEFPSWKSQEVGVGIIESLRNAPSDWCLVRWENGYINGYRYKGYPIDLILKGPHMSTTRTIPSKDQVLKAASECPQTKDALKILFPQDFEEEFDWDDFEQNPFKYIEVTKPCSITPSKELERAYEKIGYRIPNWFTPLISLTTLKRLIDFLFEHKGQ